MSETADEFELRPARPSDESFVFSSFLRSYRESDVASGIPNGRYFAVMKPLWQRVVDSFTVLVAHPAGQPDEIAGWIAYSGNVIAWIYVKHTPWRRLGVARRLLDHAHWPRRCLFGSDRMLHLAHAKGYRVDYLSFAQGTWMLEPLSRARQTAPGDLFDVTPETIAERAVVHGAELVACNVEDYLAAEYTGERTRAYLPSGAHVDVVVDSAMPRGKAGIVR